MRFISAAAPAIGCILFVIAAAQAAELRIAGKPWGTPAAAFEELLPVGDKGRLAYFAPPRGGYRILGVQPRALIYGFFDDRLFAVYAGIEGVDDFAALRRQLQEKLGLPKISLEARGGLRIFSWKSAESRVKLKHYETSGVMKLSVFHAGLAREANLALQQELDEEPPEPVFPLTPTRQREAVDLLEWSTR